MDNASFDAQIEAVERHTRALHRLALVLVACAVVQLVSVVLAFIKLA